MDPEPEAFIPLVPRPVPADPVAAGKNLTGRAAAAPAGSAGDPGHRVAGRLPGTRALKTMNGKTTGQAARARGTDVHHLARHQVMGLSAQFLFGMAVNLIGQPSQTTGAARTVSTVLLVLHILVAIALVAGAARIIRAARGSGERPRRLAHWGAILTGVTFVTGVATAATKNDWLSYAMAAGFIASLLLYGSLLVQGQGQGLARQPE